MMHHKPVDAGELAQVMESLLPALTTTNLKFAKKIYSDNQLNVIDSSRR